MPNILKIGDMTKVRLEKQLINEKVTLNDEPQYRKF